MCRLVMAMMLASCLGGCALSDAQLRLIEQARRGVQHVTSARQQRQQLIESMYDARRMQLDQAFDEDVRSQEELSAEWVIEHRRAYAVGLEALGAQREASRQADRAIADNLEAIDAALRRLEAIQSMYVRWWQEVSR